MPAAITARLKAAEKALPSQSLRGNPLIRYQADPVGYMREVLRLRPWHVQEEICRLLLQPPHRVLVRASHSVGKTWLCAAIVSWFYDCFPESATLTTAPTARDVSDLLWREIRLQRAAAGRSGFRGAARPLLQDSPSHYAKGITAESGESFQGRHQEHMLFILDEAIGIRSIFWDTIRTMFLPGGKHFAVAICNPTDSSSQFKHEEDSGGWHVVQMGSLDHPNLQAGLRGEAVPYPGAVTLQQFEDWLQAWSDPIEPTDAQPEDLEFPPASGKWYRPGPQMEARALGRWPSQSVNAVWSEGLWQKVLATRMVLVPKWPVQIGCDVAQYGDDFTAIHVRWGCCSMHHEEHNGWSVEQTAGRLKQLANEYGGFADRSPKNIPILVDSGGIGGAVPDLSGGYNFVPINSACTAQDEERYSNLRSELWFHAREIARGGVMDVSRLPRETLALLARQLQSQQYKIDGRGRAWCLPKSDAKGRVKRSPDSADAFNLAYLSYRGAADPWAKR